MEISGLPRRFSTCCLRFTSGVATTHAKLASGWLASLYREEVEPSGSLQKVSDHILVLLFWIYPGARRAVLHLSYSVTITRLLDTATPRPTEPERWPGASRETPSTHRAPARSAFAILFAKEAPSNHKSIGIRQTKKCKEFFQILQ
jgi:hypothetical protein